MAQIRVQVENPVGKPKHTVRGRLPVAILRVAVGLAARAGRFRPHVAALIGDEHGLPPPLQPGKLVEDLSELSHGEQGLAEVEVKDVVLARRASEERGSAG